jgi:hypothetical protein
VRKKSKSGSMRAGNQAETPAKQNYTRNALIPRSTHGVIEVSNQRDELKEGLCTRSRKKSLIQETKTIIDRYFWLRLSC